MRALITVLFLAIAAPAWAQASVAFLQAGYNTTDGTTFTFASQNFGAAATDRLMIVGVAGRRSGTSNCSLTSATIGGIAATIVEQVANNPTNCNVAALVVAAVPTGTSGTITLTFPATFALAGIQVYRATGVHTATPHATGESTAAAPTGTLTTPAYGFSIAIAATRDTAATTTWTGHTEQSDAVNETIMVISSALLTPTTLSSSQTVTATFTGTTESVGVWASWTPIGPLAVTPTHFVTVGGSASGSCTVGTPCNLTRAFAIAGTGLAPPGSYFSIAAGHYVQAAITTTGGGASGFRTRMVGAGTGSGGTFFSGLETFIQGSDWTLSTGCGGTCTYTYQTPFSNTGAPGGYSVGIFGQLPTASTWVPIVVDSRSAPFTSGSGRAYTLDEPVKYTPQTSIASVEAQHCTSYHNGTTDILYMHPCREAAPTDDDRYAAGRANYGEILYNSAGDYLTLESVTMSMTSAPGMRVDGGALGNLFDDIKANGSKFWFKGNSTIATDFLLKQNLVQGPPHANCYGDIYGGGGINSRSCWSYNTSGSSEYLILIGQENVTGLNQSFDRIAMERAWNGFTMHGLQTLNHATCFGLDNHCGQAYGTGYTLTNGMFETSQDSLYMEGESFNNITISNNIFRNGVLVWCSRDGANNGSTCPTNWTFTKNVLGSLVLDTLVQPSLFSDCNAWIPRSAGSTIWRMTPVDGVGSDPQYTTLTQIQTNTNDDDHSVFHDYPAMTNGTIFANHSSQEVYPMDFTLTPYGASALATSCGQAGPDTLLTAPPSQRYRPKMR